MANGFQFHNMKIKNTIYFFSAKDEKGVIVSNLRVGNEVKFPTGSMKKQICFQSNKKDNCFDLIFYNRDEIRQFQIRENKYLDKKELEQLGLEFSFDVISDPIHPEYLRGTLLKINSVFSLPLMGVLKKTENSYFFMIFATRGTTNFENDIVYVYGIWEVSLSKKTESIFFNLSNRIHLSESGNENREENKKKK